MGIDYNDSMYYMGYFSPTSDSWSTGDREFACYVSNEDRNGDQRFGAGRGPIARA